MSNKQTVLSYAEQKYHTQPDNPFHHFPDYIALRHGEGGSWFGLIMNVPRTRLGIQGLLNRKGFIPAYHMDKRNWVSILLDDSVPDDLVSGLIDGSYELTR